MSRLHHVLARCCHEWLERIVSFAHLALGETIHSTIVLAGFLLFRKTPFLIRPVIAVKSLVFSVCLSYLEYPHDVSLPTFSL